MDVKEQILNMIKLKGPILPTAISKEINAESYFASAHLSELKELGKLRISNLKVGGGSPLYFLPGQESQLQEFVDNLGEKEKKVYDLLKDKKVLKDSKLVPVFRAAIRTIKDFASPFTVKINGEKELFWKWYLLPKNETQELIRNFMGIKKEEKVEDKKETQEKLEEKKVEQKSEKVEEPVEEKITEEIPTDSFYGEINSYFTDNKIKVVEESIIRKKSDIEFIVEIPSPLGNLRYFVKAKSKKKINEGDLSTVFIQSQTKRLPALFLSKGELTKKAQEMLDTEFRGMKFQQV